MDRYLKNSFAHALTLIKIKIFSTVYCSSVNEIHTYYEHVLTVVDSWVPPSNHWNSYFESIKHFNIDFTHDSLWSDILCYYQTRYPLPYETRQLRMRLLFYFQMHYLVRKDIDINEHHELFEITLRHKFMQRTEHILLFCISLFLLVCQFVIAFRVSKLSFLA